MDAERSLYLLEMTKLAKKRKIDKGRGSLHNSWRSKVYTRKGRLIGYPEKWTTFAGFCEDMEEGWSHGKILRRKDLSKPYSKENCFWAEKGTENQSKLLTLTYQGETKTLAEWCNIYQVNYNGARLRLVRGKNYTPEEIIFGKLLAIRMAKIRSINSCFDELQKRDKISKMLSAYRCKDKKRGLETTISNDELRSIVENGKCIYCGDTENIGLDRIDNTKGHTIDNVVPCCYECNVARGNNFTMEEMMIIGKAIAEVKSKRQNNDEILYNLRVVHVSNSQ